MLYKLTETRSQRTITVGEFATLQEAIDTVYNHYSDKHDINGEFEVYFGNGKLDECVTICSRWGLEIEEVEK